MIAVGLVAFTRQEMHRDGVTTESVDCQCVELLRLTPLALPLHRDPRVSEHYVDAGSAVFAVAEVLIRKPEHLGVNLIEADVISLVAVSSQCGGAEADHADTQSLSLEPARMAGYGPA